QAELDQVLEVHDLGPLALEEGREGALELWHEQRLAWARRIVVVRDPVDGVAAALLAAQREIGEHRVLPRHEDLDPVPGARQRARERQGVVLDPRALDRREAVDDQADPHRGWSIGSALPRLNADGNATRSLPLAGRTFRTGGG